MRQRSPYRNKYLLIALAVSTAISAYCQQGGEPSVTPAQPAQSLPAGGKTNQPVVAELRDPFLPVGMSITPSSNEVIPTSNSTNQQPQKIAAPIVHEIKWPKLNVKAKMKKPNGRNVAYIEGIGVVEAGEIVSQSSDGFMYRWRVETVTETNVTFTKLDATADNRATTPSKPSKVTTPDTPSTPTQTAAPAQTPAPTSPASAPKPLINKMPDNDD